jgi:Whirly transcription factor
MNETINTESTKAYSNGYAIYKPNQRGTGGVVRFNLNAEKGAVFVEAAAQSGEKQFDWDSKIIMKWGLSDIGSVLTAQAKLFHKTEKASSTFELTFRDDPERAPYALTISRQEEADKSLRKVSIPLTHAEATILESALRLATQRILGW